MRKIHWPRIGINTLSIDFNQCDPGDVLVIKTEDGIIFLFLDEKSNGYYEQVFMLDQNGFGEMISLNSIEGLEIGTTCEHFCWHRYSCGLFEIQKLKVIRDGGRRIHEFTPFSTREEVKRFAMPYWAEKKSTVDINKLNSGDALCVQGFSGPFHIIIMSKWCNSEPYRKVGLIGRIDQRVNTSFQECYMQENDLASSEVGIISLYYSTGRHNGSTGVDAREMRLVRPPWPWPL